MSDQNSTTPAAGWYPDPAGSPQTRWWDGTRWTDHYSAPTAPVVTPAVTPWSTPAAGAPTPYPSMTPYGAAPALKAPEGTSPSTPYIWSIAVLPVVSIALSLAQLATIDATIDSALDPNSAPFTPTDLVNYGVSLLLAAATVLFAVFDVRTLATRGVPRPFHWAWSFFALVSLPVYMIGRSVVVRRRVGSGLAPMFVNLSLLAVNFVIGIIAAVIAAGRILENVPFS